MEKNDVDGRTKLNLIPSSQYSSAVQYKWQRTTYEPPKHSMQPLTPPPEIVDK